MALALNIDATGIDAATKKAKAGLDSVIASARGTEAALKKAGGGAEELKRKFDPAYAAAVKLGNEMDDLDRALKLGAINAKQYGAEIGRMGSATGAASGRFGKLGNSLQNVGYQVGDFAVQVGAGTSAAQALGQQLPQLLQGFGLLGVGLSVVAAVGIPLAAAFWGADGGAKSLTSAVDDLATATERYRSSAEASIAPMSSMIERYGSMAREAKVALSAIAGADQAAAIQSMNTTIASMSAEFMQATTARDALMSGRKGAKLELATEFDLARSASIALADSFEALVDANGPREIADAALHVVNALDSARDSAGQLPPELEAAYGTLAAMSEQASSIVGTTDLITRSTFDWSDALGSASDAAASVVANAPGGGWLSGAIGDAVALGSSLWDAAAAAAAVAARPVMNGPMNTGSADWAKNGLGFTKPGSDLVYTPPKVRTGGGGGGRKSAGGGGGGISETEKASNAYDSLIASLDPAERATQDLAKAQETVNAALKVGAISADEAANAMKLAGEKYSVAGDMWGEFQNAGGNALDRLIDGTATLGEALKDMVKEMVIAIAKKKLLASVEGGSAGDSLGGLIFRGLTGGFAGLFDGGGTIGAGKTGIVGEHGPEMVTAKSSGAVVTSRVDTARQLGRQSGGGVVMGEIKVSVDDKGAIQAYVQRMGIQAAGAAVSQVRRNMQGWGKEIQAYGV